MSVLESVRAIIAANLKVAPTEVTEKTSMETHPAWDSLAHINIMMSVEQAFDLYLDVEEFPKLNSVLAIVGYLQDVQRAAD
jgi:acyl carrier protein